MIPAIRKGRRYIRTWGFAKVILILKVGNTTKESELELNKATKSNKKIYNNGRNRIEEAVHRKI